MDDFIFIIIFIFLLFCIISIPCFFVYRQQNLDFEIEKMKIEYHYEEILDE